MDERSLIQSFMQSVDSTLQAEIKALLNDKEAQALKATFWKDFPDVLQTANAELLKPQSVSVSDEIRVTDEVKALEEYDRELSRVVFKREDCPKYIQNKAERMIQAQYKSLNLLSVDIDNSESLLMPDCRHRSCPRDIPILASTTSQIRGNMKELQSLPNKVQEINACLDFNKRFEKQKWKLLLNKRQGR